MIEQHSSNSRHAPRTQSLSTRRHDHRARSKRDAHQYDSDVPSPPLYQQIARVLVSRIHHGLYAEGGLIPSENTLSDEFGVTRLTIRHALNELRHEGVLISRRGSGTYVVQGSRVKAPAMFTGYLEDMILQSLVLETSILSVRHAVPPGDVRDALRMTRRERCVVVERLRSAEGVAVRWSINYIPGAIASRIDWKGQDLLSITEFLGRNGSVTSKALRTFGAISANPRLARLLNVRPRTALLRSDVTSFAMARPINFSRVVYAPGHAQFSVSLIPIAREHFRTKTIRRA